MIKKLHLLKPQFKEHLPADFYTSASLEPDLSGYLENFAREVDLQPVMDVIHKAFEKFDRTKAASSDEWLAPRIHATLRLTRREAGDRRVWYCLAAGPLFSYVHWRWAAGKEISRKFPSRFFGSMREHAVARLWWGAELTRNGASYEMTKLFFQKTDIPNSWINLRAMRHRPAAVAAVDFIYKHDIDGVPVGDRHRDLVKAFNTALTTTVLDAVAKNPPDDAAAIEDWMAERPDGTLYFEKEPSGPAESSVSETSIEACLELLKRIAERTNFKRRKRGPDAT